MPSILVDELKVSVVRITFISELEGAICKAAII